MSRLSRDRTAPRVLVADDDFALRLLMSESLSLAGFEVMEASDGLEAVERFFEFRPDIVLLDVEMPGLDGFEVCERIRDDDARHRIPVVMVTGLDDIDSVNRAYDAAATDFITKPINWTILGHRVRYMLRASQAFRDLQRSEEENHALLSALPDVIYVIRRDGVLLDIKGAGSVVSEEVGVSIVGRNIDDVFPPELVEHARDLIERALDTGEMQTLDCSIRSAGGARHYEVRYIGFDEDEALAVVRDVTERKSAQDRVQFLAFYDGLTGLPNRQFFMDRMQRALDVAERDGHRCAALFLDLDRFKRINDTFGHSVGDELLKSVADTLRKCLRDNDCIARFGEESADITHHLARLGGDEFTILLPQIVDSEDAAIVARRILESVSRPYQLDDYEVFVTASVGVAVYPYDGQDVDALLKNADTAMYHAKGDGRNTFQLYVDTMNALSLQRIALEGELRRALDRDELLLHYQPQIDGRTGRVIGLEALVRWLHPERGMVSPGDFIPVAEESGLIVPLGDWVLREACAFMCRWIADGHPPLRIAINQSSEQFRRGDLTDRIKAALASSGLPPRLLELEITESLLMQHTDDTTQMLQDIRALGVRLSVDDFGTGYSSLSYLKRFPLDTLKIDQSFIRDLVTDADAHSSGTSDHNAIAAVIIALGHTLHLEVVAEGVELVGQVDYLRRHGCDVLQGFYFARPVPEASVPAAIEAAEAAWPGHRQLALASTYSDCELKQRGAGR